MDPHSTGPSAHAVATQILAYHTSLSAGNTPPSHTSRLEPGRVSRLCVWSAVDQRMLLTKHTSSIGRRALFPTFRGRVSQPQFFWTFWNNKKRRIRQVAGHLRRATLAVLIWTSSARRSHLARTLHLHTDVIFSFRQRAERGYQDFGTRLAHPLHPSSCTISVEFASYFGSGFSASASRFSSTGL